MIQNPHITRALARTVIDSMNACDVTRHHELPPSMRLASRTKLSRMWAMAIGVALFCCAVAALGTVAAVAINSAAPASLADGER